MRVRVRVPSPVEVEEEDRCGWSMGWWKMLLIRGSRSPFVFPQSGLGGAGSGLANEAIKGKTGLRRNWRLE